MEKRFIPGTNPKWDRELPDEDINSLVDKNGNNWDNGYNFDEKDDEEDTPPFDPEAAKKARETDKI
ncbi:hypothetical protein IJG92_03395 [Candidatus Saccharibacteria bacterium]|nr:hypothetical protein [Candidatus Saccharibacteria bacterium]MBQ6149641.1 hypothetical protein [Candidatus Saccharibacteria bacterium]